MDNTKYLNKKRESLNDLLNMLYELGLISLDAWDDAYEASFLVSWAAYE
jgi:hypothetical protein